MLCLPCGSLRALHAQILLNVSRTAVRLQRQECPHMDILARAVRFVSLYSVKPQTMYSIESGDTVNFLPIFEE